MDCNRTGWRADWAMSTTCARSRRSRLTGKIYSILHIIVLALLRLEDRAYGVSVRQEIEFRTNREVSIGVRSAAAHCRLARQSKATHGAGKRKRWQDAQGKSLAPPGFEPGSLGRRPAPRIPTLLLAATAWRRNVEASEAIVAIGHKILVLAHYLLQHNCRFRELGADYYQRLRAPSLSQSPVRRLQRLGYQVTLAPAPQPM
jgi:hypothetical protein